MKSNSRLILYISLTAIGIAIVAFILVATGQLSALFGCVFLLPIFLYTFGKPERSVNFMRAMFGFNIVVGLAVINGGDHRLLAGGIFVALFTTLYWKVFKPHELF